MIHAKNVSFWCWRRLALEKTAGQLVGLKSKDLASPALQAKQQPKREECFHEVHLKSAQVKHLRKDHPCSVRSRKEERELLDCVESHAGSQAVESQDELERNRVHGVALEILQRRLQTQMWIRSSRAWRAYKARPREDSTGEDWR